jgi:hypothetical protein
MLFMILVAVALFAALSYAVTLSGRSAGNGTALERGQIVAAKFLNYMGAIQMAMTRMQLANDCTPDQIDFHGWNLPGVPGGSQGYWGASPPPTNANRKADGSCDLFSSAGGGITPMAFGSEICKSGVTCGFTFYRVPIKGVGKDTSSTSPSHADNADETILFGWKVDANFCRALNGIQKISAPPWSETWYQMSEDPYGNASENSVIGGDAGHPEFRNHPVGCFLRDNAAQEYDVYFTVIER